MDRSDPAYEGQREYTPLFLRIYDPLILGVFAPVIWRCSASRLVDGYRRHVGHRHLDVTVANGAGPDHGEGQGGDRRTGGHYITAPICQGTNS